MVFHKFKRFVTNFALRLRLVTKQVHSEIRLGAATVSADVALKWASLQVNSIHVVDEKMFLAVGTRA